MLTWHQLRDALPVLALRVDPEHLEGDLVDQADALGVETEVLIALGTRDWWGDAYAEDGKAIGSRLHLLDSAIATEENARRAETEAALACEPIVKEGRARAIVPRATLEGARIAMTIEVTLLDGRTKSVGPVRVN